MFLPPSNDILQLDQFGSVDAYKKVSTGDTKEFVKMDHKAFGNSREIRPFGGSSSMVVGQFMPL